MTLDAHEFTRRFLLHNVPDDFHRIRHYGLLDNGHPQLKVGLCRSLLDVSSPELPLKNRTRYATTFGATLPLLRRSQDRVRIAAFVEESHGHGEPARHFRFSPRFVNNMVILKSRHACTRKARSLWAAAN